METIPARVSIPFKLVHIGSTTKLVLDDTCLDADTIKNLGYVLFLPMNPVPPDILSAVQYKSYEDFVDLVKDVPNVDYGTYFQGLAFGITAKERMEAAPKSMDAFVTALWSRSVRRAYAKKQDPFKNLTGACSAPKACDCYSCTSL